MNNEYMPFISEIKEIIKHTDIEYTFRMTYDGDVKPGQFLKYQYLLLEKLLYL